MVCAGRAVATERRLDEHFSDPTAFALLPDAARESVSHFLARGRPRGVRELMQYIRLQPLAAVMTVRTMTIDRAIVAGATPQLVILGAGLDGRAYRMPELNNTVVFEVDHPDSQREKRERVAQLTATAREVRFVPVDFARDSLDTALTQAGHDPSQPTTFVWEGVVMYLSEDAIAATMRVIARRSAPGSSLIIVYHVPSWMVLVIAPMVRMMNEPLRSHTTPAEMRQLLAGYDYRVVSDDAVAELAKHVSPKLAREIAFATHLHVAVAEWQGSAPSQHS